MSNQDDWQHDLIPRNVKITKEAKVLLDKICQDISRGPDIFDGLNDFLKDCAHKGKQIYNCAYETQGYIPQTNKRISCQYTFNPNSVEVYDIWIEEIN